VEKDPTLVDTVAILAITVCMLVAGAWLTGWHALVDRVTPRSPY
jgi:hypothetical protein